MIIRSLERFIYVISDQIVSMGGYFILAVLVAALIKTFKLDKKIRKALVKAGPWSIPLATATGLVSPLCSCGILPVAASLMVAGVPTAPVMALLITSPVMSPDAFVLTYGVLGPQMAWGKMAGAAAMGLGLGYLVHFMSARGHMPANPWKPGGRLGEHHCVDPHDPDDPRRGLSVTINRWRYFGLMVRDMSWTIGRFLLLAFVLEALLVTFVRSDLVRLLVGRPSAASVLLAVAVGLPIPLQQVAAVPVLRGLLDLGTNPGAAMALLMTGPVTSIPAVVFLSGMVDKKLLWAYMAIGIVGSLAIGMAYIA